MTEAGHAREVLKWLPVRSPVDERPKLRLGGRIEIRVGGDDVRAREAAGGLDEPLGLDRRVNDACGRELRASFVQQRRRVRQATPPSS